jgi:hypothetical protein
MSWQKIDKRNFSIQMCQVLFLFLTTDAIFFSSDFWKEMWTN